MSSTPRGPNKDQAPTSLYRLAYPATVCCIDISLDGKLLAAGHDNGVVSVRGLPLGQRVRDWLPDTQISTGNIKWVGDVKFSPDGRWLAACSIFSGRPAIWSVATGEALLSPTPTGSVNCMAFSPDSQSLAYAGNDKKVQIVNIGPNQSVSQETLAIAFPNNVNSLCFSPDRTKLATGSTNLNVSVWDLQKGSLIHTLPPHRGSVSVAFSADGDLLLSGSADKTVRVWQVEKGSMLEVEKLSGLSLMAVAWGPDSMFWAARTNGSPGVVRLWDWRRRLVIKDIPQLSTQENNVWPTRALAVSQNGDVLVTYTPQSLRDLEVWDISAVSGVAVPSRSQGRAQGQMTAAADLALRQHLATLPLAHTKPPTPSRPALWLRSAASVGTSLPLFLAQDLGTVLTRRDAQSELARPDHLPAKMDTSAYLAFLHRVARQPLLREVSGWGISDAMIGVVLARSVAGVSFPVEYALPAGRELVECTRLMGKELDRVDPGRIWGGDKTPGNRPSLGALVTPDSLARIETNLLALGADELRFLHQYGPRFSGAPDPRRLLDLFSLLNMPPAVRLALSQVLRLLPRVSQSVKAGSIQTYSLGGYAGLTHKGNLDNLVLTELAHSEPMLLHRLMNREALYYGREAERERRRELAYIVTQAGLELLGDSDVIARALTLALAQTMARRGYVVEQSFVGSTWTPPANMSDPSDVHRVLYYKDGGWLRASDMLSAVSERLRADAERYRSMQVMWVVSEFWDADEWAEHEKLYAALRQRGEQQVWVIRVGGGQSRRRGDCPAAIRQLGRCQVVNSDVLWTEHAPPERISEPKKSGEAPGVIRFDGLYQARGDMRFHWYYLKFFKPGSVWYMASNEPPDRLWWTAARDLISDKLLIQNSELILGNNSGGGSFILSADHPGEESSRLSFSITTLLAVVDYEGTVSGDNLKLHWSNKANGREGAEEYRFVPVEMDED